MTWTNSLGMEFVPVEGLKGVLFSKWVTRVQDFQVFADETNQRWAKPDFKQGPTHPAVNVNWETAKAFCEWLTKKEQVAKVLLPKHQYRLPMDWEWSVAAGLNEPREGTPYEKDGKIRDVYPWGKQWPPPKGAGNYCGEEMKGIYPDWPVIQGYTDGYAGTSPVGSFDATTRGLYDMSGNVWEWCEDKYQPSEESRVLRGGAWSSYFAPSLWLSFREYTRPEYVFPNNGFRCVVSVSE
jgi:formylglycine-generating enzyme required for sulfatase activity